MKLGKLGVLSVDSGTILVGDPCYFKVDYEPHPGDSTQLFHENGATGKGVVVSNFGGDVPCPCAASGMRTGTLPPCLLISTSPERNPW